MLAYFIMGRSANSRNRIFQEYGEELRTQPFDESKVEDPSLIIYSAIKRVGSKVIVTNGDQTDTIEEGLKRGECMRGALRKRRFEPDAPNFTPRISAVIDLSDGSYSISILKSADAEGAVCNRFTFDYEPISGIGHFIHTYMTDGNPLPSFEGEPERVSLPDTLQEFADEIWSNLDTENKISLCCREISFADLQSQSIVYNKYTR